MNLKPSILLLLVAIPIVYSAQYVPGTPGAPWSEAEMLVVKTHIHNIIDDPERALKKVPKIPVEGKLKGKKKNGKQINKRWKKLQKKENSAAHGAVLPNAAKILRLAFHDCLVDSETGGCNGCLNFDGMGEENVNMLNECAHDGSCPKDAPSKKGDNNNLLWVAAVLEEIYMNDHPPFAYPKTEENQMPNGSLFSTGKSRADLWHFAALVAVEFTAAAHNFNCDATQPAPCAGQVDENSPPCNYTLPTLQFTSGRKDCVPSCEGKNSAFGFCTEATEVHPDAHGNGQVTAQFFADNFGFSNRETVAIMGGHSLGHANEKTTGFKHYPWEDVTENMLTNRYYQIMSSEGHYRKMWAIGGGEFRITKQDVADGQCDLNVSSFAGDEEGNPVKNNWLVKSEARTNAFGNWNWNPFGNKCDPRKCDEVSQPYAKTSCCLHIGGGTDGFCWRKRKQNIAECNVMLCNRDNPNTGTTDVALWDDINGDWTDACEMPVFMSMSYLNVDMGLYRDFNTDSNGRPFGCTGMDYQPWVNNEIVWSEPTDCPKNADLSGFVEEYANDIQTWSTDFVAAMDKMMKNGYSNSDLTVGPTNWNGATCTPIICTA